MAHKNAQPIPYAATNVGDSGRVLGFSLRQVRQRAGLTQGQVAARLGVNQAAISKIERRGDIHISSLVKYLEALGGQLRVDALFDGVGHGSVPAIDANRPDASDEKQLILPLFNDALLHEKRAIILAVHPIYSKKIIEGEKTIELRRRFTTNAAAGRTAYIYSTAPVQALVGYANIVNIKKHTTEDLWLKYKCMARIDKKSFDAYFLGVNYGYALEFAEPRPFSRPIRLAELRTRFSFTPPQSFSYAQPALLAALHHDYTSLSN